MASGVMTFPLSNFLPSPKSLCSLKASRVSPEGSTASAVEGCAHQYAFFQLGAYDLETAWILQLPAVPSGLPGVHAQEILLTHWL